MEAVGAALQLGYDVVFTDVDIALLHDPIDHLFLPGIDYVHSTNKGCNARWKFNETMEGNTGMYAVRQISIIAIPYPYFYCFFGFLYCLLHLLYLLYLL